ncbi:nitroreductase [Brevundimonas guildfordensis]|uniref:nitroreductase n=1 Tax=Brevundimonas guildfordensis TaxID=2762241 RepID=UPI00296ABD1D|nr:nitroreductase [Brevundimonas guildfordensis]
MKSLTVSDAVASRRSVRAFLPTPVDEAVLRRVLETALRTPSGGNLQPWRLRVVSGEALERLKAAVVQRAIERPEGESADYPIYPSPLASPWRDRRYRAGEDLYAALKIPREDKPARRSQFLNNYRAFGAPVVIFFHIQRSHGAPQWSDVGMLMQTLMLLLREAGLDTCPQEAWAPYAATVDAHLGADSEEMLFAGLAVGFRDPDAAVNRFHVARAPIDEIVSFHD